MYTLQHYVMACLTAGGTVSSPCWMRFPGGSDGIEPNRLRRTVARRCVNEDWPIDLFLRLAEKKSRYVMLLRTLRKCPNGKDYLEAFRHQIGKDVTRYPKWKVKHLSREYGTEDEAIL